ncbi:MAG: hypothetical protein KH251_08395 [Lachnospiraceae bacterium]|nr:hypothetical protein [Lachnospiraceae bacterium]
MKRVVSMLIVAAMFMTMLSGCQGKEGEGRRWIRRQDGTYTVVVGRGRCSRLQGMA